MWVWRCNEIVDVVQSAAPISMSGLDAAAFVIERGWPDEPVEPAVRHPDPWLVTEMQ